MLPQCKSVVRTRYQEGINKKMALYRKQGVQRVRNQLRMFLGGDGADWKELKERTKSIQKIFEE